MASYRIVLWRNIPASVEASEGGQTVTRELSERFQMLIDSVAMQLGLHESDAYIELWARGAPEERAGSAKQVAEASRVSRGGSPIRRGIPTRDQRFHIRRPGSRPSAREDR